MEAGPPAGREATFASAPQQVTQLASPALFNRVTPGMSKSGAKTEGMFTSADM